MALTDEQLAKYQQLHLEQFGEKLPADEARRRGEQLIELIRTIRRPLPDPEDRRT